MLLYSQGENMKVLIYCNKGKDVDKKFSRKLISVLNDYKIEYYELQDSDLSKKMSADALFSIGGDGTILYLTEFSNKNAIPIIGINAGKLGFLTEFEISEIEDAVKSLSNGLLIKDERLSLKVEYNGNVYYALNDVFIQRIYSDSLGCMTADIKVKINGVTSLSFKGDGLVVASPTGSTAYSLSAGGSILTLDLPAFSVTPIAAHTFNQRSVVFSSDSVCQIENIGKAHVGLFTDGKFVGELHRGESIQVTKSERKTLFLRKKDYNVFKTISYKMSKNYGGEYND